MSSATSTQFIEDHPFWGREFDWAARDRQGKVGYFSTAGAAPIPGTCLSGEAAFETLFEDVMQLPVISTVEIVDKSSREISDWIAVAERGLYAYDWSRQTLCYELVAKPNQPIPAESLPTRVRMTATATSLDTSFEELKCLVTLTN